MTYYSIDTSGEIAYRARMAAPVASSARHSSDSASTAQLLQRARIERAERPSSAIDRMIINIALGAGFCWAGSDLLVESLSSPGRVYTVTSTSCDCQARKPCWHMKLYTLLLDTPADKPDWTKRLAAARRAHMKGAI